MPVAQANGIEIGYEASGHEDGTPLLLIHGLGAPIVRAPPKFSALPEQRGYHVIRLENRDTGLSTHFHDAPMPDLARVAPGSTDIPYTLSDMAADAVGLLDALGIDSAHVLGVSLGGMITQTMVIEHPSRVLSATVMMSQNGNPAMPGTSPEAMAVLTTPAPDPFTDREAFLDHQVRLNQALGSPDYPTPLEELREL